MLQMISLLLTTALDFLRDFLLPFKFSKGLIDCVPCCDYIVAQATPPATYRPVFIKNNTKRRADAGEEFQKYAILFAQVHTKGALSMKNFFRDYIKQKRLDLARPRSSSAMASANP